MIDKKILRARMRADRDAFVMAGTRMIEPPVEYLARLSPGMIVASYIPIGSEADPSMLAWAARERGCILALPHVTSREEPIRFLSWHAESMLADGPFGLSQPSPDCAQVAPDVILTPLVAFDAELNRLGQGAGHYDRAFAAHPAAWRMGVAWSVQQLDALPADVWDVPLHAIVTEQAFLIRTGS